MARINVLAAIAGIVILEAIALFMGMNGLLFMTVIAVLSGLGGYIIMDDMKEVVKLYFK